MISSDFFVPFVDFCSKDFVVPDFLPASTGPPDDKARSGELVQLFTRILIERNRRSDEIGRVNDGEVSRTRANSGELG